MIKKKKPTKIKVGEIPKELIMDAQKPRYNPFQGGTGAHKSKKAYTRKKKHSGKEW